MAESDTQRTVAMLNALVSLERLIEAAVLIDKYGCEHFAAWSEMRCFHNGSEQRRGAEFTADAWCNPCIARAALEPELVGDEHKDP